MYNNDKKTIRDQSVKIIFRTLIINVYLWNVQSVCPLLKYVRNTQRSDILQAALHADHLCQMVLMMALA